MVHIIETTLDRVQGRDRTVERASAKADKIKNNRYTNVVQSVYIQWVCSVMCV